MAGVSATLDLRLLAVGAGDSISRVFGASGAAGQPSAPRDSQLSEPEFGDPNRWDALTKADAVDAAAFASAYDAAHLGDGLTISQEKIATKSIEIL